MRFSLHSPVRPFALSALLAATVAGCAAMAPAPATVANGVLTGPNGMTLYTFDKDVVGNGKSACNGPCASNWPPLMAADTDKPAGDYGIVVRDDGKKQWTFKGKPLYYWVKDTKPGEQTGNGFNKVWQVARP